MSCETHTKDAVGWKAEQSAHILAYPITKCKINTFYIQHDKTRILDVKALHHLKQPKLVGEGKKK